MHRRQLLVRHPQVRQRQELTLETGIDRKLRELIIEGLAACERLQPRLDIASIHRAAQEVLHASKGR